jgi:hypothetical protein
MLGSRRFRTVYHPSKGHPFVRTPSSSIKYLALAFGLAVIGSGACGSSESSKDAGILNGDGMAGSAGHDGSAGAGGTAGIDGGAVVDSSIVDTAKADVAVDVSLGSEAGKPVDAGILTEVGAVDASASEAGHTVDVGVTADAKDSALPTSTANLIVNGDAEAAVGSTDGSPVATPGWTITAEATAIQYGASGGYPASTDPGPANRGHNFFAGGQSDEVSTLTQTISLDAYTSAIAGHGVTFALSAYLGGYSSQEDNAVLSLSFRNAGGAEVGTASIGPVTATERADNTGLLPKSATGTVPAAARSVIVTLTMTRLEGTANDGYADNLSLVLTGI